MKTSHVLFEAPLQPWSGIFVLVMSSLELVLGDRMTIGSSWLLLRLNHLALETWEEEITMSTFQDRSKCYSIAADWRGQMWLLNWIFSFCIEDFWQPFALFSLLSLPNPVLWRCQTQVKPNHFCKAVGHIFGHKADVWGQQQVWAASC